MAERLTEGDLDGVANILAPADLKTFAIRYLGLNRVEIDTIEAGFTQKDQQGFKHEVLNTWANKNEHSKQGLKALLKQAATEHGLVAWFRVEEILGTSNGSPGSTAQQTNSHTGAPAPPTSGTGDNHPALTIIMIQALSERITNPGDLQKLGITGLELEEHEVEKCIDENKGSTTGAALQMLKTWRKGCNVDDKEKYRMLCDALDSVKMSFYKNVLK